MPRKKGKKESKKENKKENKKGFVNFDVKLGFTSPFVGDSSDSNVNRDKSNNKNGFHNFKNTSAYHNNNTNRRKNDKFKNQNNSYLYSESNFNNSKVKFKNHNTNRSGRINCKNESYQYNTAEGNIKSKEYKNSFNESNNNNKNHKDPSNDFDWSNIGKKIKGILAKGHYKYYHFESIFEQHTTETCKKDKNDKEGEPVLNIYAEEYVPSKLRKTSTIDNNNDNKKKENEKKEEEIKDINNKNKEKDDKEKNNENKIETENNNISNDNKKNKNEKDCSSFLEIKEMFSESPDENKIESNNKKKRSSSFNLTSPNSNTYKIKSKKEIEIKNEEKNENNKGNKKARSKSFSLNGKPIKSDLDPEKINPSSTINKHKLLLENKSQSSDFNLKNLKTRCNSWTYSTDKYKTKNNDKNEIKTDREILTLTTTKHKFLIKFFKVLKIIALIGFILTAIITAGAIFSAVFPTFATFITTNFSWVAPIFASYIKPAITTAISVFVFAVSKLFLSYLSKQKESESQDLKQFGTNVDKENQNEIAINKNIGQIPKRGNDQVVTENRLNSK